MYELQLIFQESGKKYTLPEEIFHKVFSEEELKRLKEAVLKELERHV